MFTGSRIDITAFSFSYRNNKHDDLIILNLINETVTGRTEFDFITVGQSPKFIRLNTWCL